MQQAIPASQPVSRAARSSAPFRPGSRSCPALRAAAVCRKVLQLLEPRSSCAAVDGRARRVDTGCNGLRSAGDIERDATLQYQRVAMRAAIAAFEHIEHGREIGPGVAAEKFA